MRSLLLLETFGRQYPDPVASWMQMALTQLGYSEAALQLYRMYLVAGGITSATHSGDGLYSERSDGTLLRTLMKERRPTTIEEADPIISQAMFPGEVVNIAARSFVYELAVFRLALRRAAAVSGDPAGEAATAAFDVAVPGLVPVRDTLAHLDERFARESRGRRIVPQPTTVDGDTLDLGIAMTADRIGAHTADGSFQFVELNEGTVASATTYLRAVIALYPLSPHSEDTGSASSP